MPGIDRPDGEPKPDRRPYRRGELTALVGELFDPSASRAALLARLRSVRELGHTSSAMETSLRKPRTGRARHRERRLDAMMPSTVVTPAGGATLGREMAACRRIHATATVFSPRSVGARGE